MPELNSLRETVRARSATYVMFVVALLVLAVLQVLALKFSLYYLYPWLDIPMHVLGGAVVALGFAALLPRYARGTRRGGLLAVLGFVAVVGLGWEVYEFATGSVFAHTAPLADTLLDLVMDLIGGTIGYALARSLSALESPGNSHVNSHEEPRDDSREAPHNTDAL